MRDAPVDEEFLELEAAPEGEEIVFDYASTTGPTLRRHPLAPLRERPTLRGPMTARDLEEIENGEQVIHKDSISVAAAEPYRVPGRLTGKIPHDVNKLLKVLVKVGTAEQLHVVYEAGPTGFGSQRTFKAKGYLCEIIAPRRPTALIKDMLFAE